MEYWKEAFSGMLATLLAAAGWHVREDRKIRDRVADIEKDNAACAEILKGMDRKLDAMSNEITSTKQEITRQAERHTDRTSKLVKEVHERVDALAHNLREEMKNGRH